MPNALKNYFTEAYIYINVNNDKKVYVGQQLLYKIGQWKELK